jgi:hypothetical protein
VEVQDAATDALDARTLYGILALRAAVFVVEQDCVYLDPDGRDLEPGSFGSPTTARSSPRCGCCTTRTAPRASAGSRRSRPHAARGSRPS